MDDGYDDKDYDLGNLNVPNIQGDLNDKVDDLAGE